MHAIELKYRRWWRWHTASTTFPENWSEMNARQFTALFARPDDIRLLAVMLDLPERIIRLLSLTQIYELAQLFDFIRKDTKASGFKLERIHCPKSGFLYAPKAKLSEMTFGQFIYTDSYYMQYAGRGDRDALCSLVAFLYSPEGGFDKKAAERNAVRLRKADRAVMESISLNYGLVRTWVSGRYPLVFPAGKKETAAKAAGGWPDVFDNIVGDDLKDRDKYAEIPVNAVFKFITRKIKESRDGAKVHGHR